MGRLMPCTRHTLLLAKAMPPCAAASAMAARAARSSGSLPRGGEAAGDQLDAGQRERVGHRRRLAGDVRLDAVRERVHADVRREVARHGHRQLVVHDGDGRQQVDVEHHHLDVTLRVGDHGDLRHLAARAGGRGDCDERRARVQHLVIALVLAQRLGVRGEDRDGLGGIDRAAAAQGHEQVGVEGPVACQTGADVVVGRVGLDVGEDVAGDTRVGQEATDLAGQPALGEEPVGDEQRPVRTEAARLNRQLGQGPVSDHHCRGYVERHRHERPPSKVREHQSLSGQGATALSPRGAGTVNAGRARRPMSPFGKLRAR